MSTNQLSTYLIQPNMSGAQSRRWAGFSTRLLTVRRSHNRTTSRAIMAFIIWALLIMGFQLLHSPQSATVGASSLSAIDSSLQGTTPPNAAPAVSLTKAAPAAAPTAVMASATLPVTPVSDIPISPYGTFANNYDPGQCTWYVASRRKVPSNWGNAVTWYYRAAAAGWSVGSTPRIGAIAWTGAGYFGHVAIVSGISASGGQVQVSEMNYYGPYARDTRWAPTSSFKYIY